MEQAERNLTRRSAITYTVVSLAIALIFLVAATLGGYDAVARFGGAALGLHAEHDRHHAGDHLPLQARAELAGTR